MTITLKLLAWCGCAAAIIGVSHAATAPAFPAAWKTWSPRSELSSPADVIEVEGAPALRLRAKGPASYEEWRATYTAVQGGQGYRFEAPYRTEHITHEDVSVIAVLTWLSSGGRALQRDYVGGGSAPVAGWRIATRTVRAPKAASTVLVQLALRWSDGGSVVWRQPTLADAELPAHRKVRVVTTRIKPAAPATVEANRALLADTFDQAGAVHPDLVLFTETLVSNGVNRPVADLAEPIPGPTTRLLAERARKYRTYVAASVNEREGALVYNTAVLYDRDGRLVGKYRKTHLPLSEGEDGVTPGTEYPVFDTDFGRVGMLVCWDNFFPEPARILRLRGAEMILLPINGDGVPGHWDVITRARAIDNGVYFVASSQATISPSVIIDPQGRVLASTTDGIAMAELDLDQETRVWALSVGPAEGEARSLYLRERRPDLYGPLSAPEPDRR